jgi:hypothetical protein
MRQVFWWLYGIQAFFVVPVFLGAMHRGEMVFWPWHSQHADGWATAIDVYLHLLFYSVFYVLPYYILRAAYKDDIHSTTEVLFVPISLWFLATVMLFHKSIFDFISGLPTRSLTKARQLGISGRTYCGWLSRSSFSFSGESF